jgi:hypothetical protein
MSELPLLVADIERKSCEHKDDQEFDGHIKSSSVWTGAK